MVLSDQALQHSTCPAVMHNLSRAVIPAPSSMFTSVPAVNKERRIAIPDGLAIFSETTIRGVVPAKSALSRGTFWSMRIWTACRFPLEQANVNAVLPLGVLASIFAPCSTSVESISGPPFWQAAYIKNTFCVSLRKDAWNWSKAIPNSFRPTIKTVLPYLSRVSRLNSFPYWFKSLLVVNASFSATALCNCADALCRSDSSGITSDHWCYNRALSSLQNWR